MADYKATAAQLASIANAIRLKGGTSAALEYPSEWITAIQNLIPSSGGSEITPADPTLEYKVTDTELISIANAIRAKAEISGQLEFPSEFISGINSIPSPAPTIASWANGTDEQIVALIQAAHAGTIDLQQDAGWSVGDVRTISISAFTAGGDVSVSQQDIDIAITSFDDYMGCGCVLQFDFINYINPSIRMNSINTNVGGYGATEMKTVTLPALVNALPSWLKDLLVEFPVLTSEGSGSSTIETVTGNKLALRSEVEILGTNPRSRPGEGSQLAYYNSNVRRQKTDHNFGFTTSWHLRSPNGWDSSNYLYCNGNGKDTNYSIPTSTRSVAPFGCI